MDKGSELFFHSCSRPIKAAHEKKKGALEVLNEICVFTSKNARALQREKNLLNVQPRFILLHNPMT